jgi:putative hemolysin
MPMKMVSVVTVYLVVNQCTEFLLDILKIRPSSDKITEEEIKAIIKQGTETGEFRKLNKT